MKNNKFYALKAVVFIMIMNTTAFFSCTHNNLDTTPSLPAVVSFRNNIMPLFSANCLGSGCHSGSNSVNGYLDFSTDSLAYTDLFKRGDVDTTTPASSFLYQTMNTTGSPMPPSGRLSNYDVSLVLKWIQQGAKNN